MRKNNDTLPGRKASDNGTSTPAHAAAPPMPPGNDGPPVLLGGMDDPDESPPKKPADLFADLGALRISQDFGATLGVKKALLTVPIRKPAKEWFVRTNPALRIETCVLELKEDREVYLVMPALWPELASESTFGPRALYAAMNRQGVLFVWPVRLPGSDGKIDDWNRSALEAAAMAETSWVRVASNMALGAYDVFTASAEIPEPDWPALPLNEILRVAFKGRVIESLDHPTLRRLRGEA